MRWRNNLTSKRSFVAQSVGGRAPLVAVIADAPFVAVAYMTQAIHADTDFLALLVCSVQGPFPFHEPVGIAPLPNRKLKLQSEKASSSLRIELVQCDECTCLNVLWLIGFGLYINQADEMLY